MTFDKHFRKKSEGFIEVGRFRSFTRPKCLSLTCGLRDSVSVWRAWGPWDWLAAWFSIPHIPESGFRIKSMNFQCRMDLQTERQKSIDAGTFTEKHLCLSADCCWGGRVQWIFDFLCRFLLLETSLMRAVRLHHTVHLWALKTNNELKEAKNSFLISASFSFLSAPRGDPRFFPSSCLVTHSQHVK